MQTPNNQRTTIGIPCSLLKDFKKAAGNNATQQIIDFMQGKISEMKRRKSQARISQAMQKCGKISMGSVIKSYKDGRK